MLAEGQTIYNQKCASCHGPGGNGGMGPKLAGVVANRYPDIEDQKAVIANGRSSMPAFGGTGGQRPHRRRRSPPSPATSARSSAPK